MLETVIVIVNSLSGAYEWLLKLGDKRRDTLAAHCDSVAQILEDFAASSQDRRRSINLCAQLKQFVPPIRQAGEETEDERVKELANELDRVCEVWAAASQGGDTSHQAELYQVEAGAGAFRGLANALRNE